MNVKKAIEFVTNMANSFKCISSLNIKDINNKTEDIISLLQQGGTDRKILNKLKTMHDPICFGDERFMDLCDYISNLEEEG